MLYPNLHFSSTQDHFHQHEPVCDDSSSLRMRLPLRYPLERLLMAPPKQPSKDARVHSRHSLHSSWDSHKILLWRVSINSRVSIKYSLCSVKGINSESKLCSNYGCPTCSCTEYTLGVTFGSLLNFFESLQDLRIVIIIKWDNSCKALGIMLGMLLEFNNGWMNKPDNWDQKHWQNVLF